MNTISTTKALLTLCVITVLTGCIPGLSNNNKNARPTNGGVAKSVDSGEYFEAKNVIGETSGLARSNAQSLAVSETDSNLMYLATKEDGLFVSRNAGETWEVVNFPPRLVDQVVIHPVEPNTVYVSSVWKNRGRLHRTDDGGENWNEIYVEPTDGTRVYALELSPFDPDVIYIGTTRNEAKRSTLAMSPDGGVSWENIRTNGKSVLNIGFDPRNRDQMYMRLGDNNLLRTNDRGKNWELVLERERKEGEEPFYGRMYSFYAHDSRPGEIYVGTDRSLYKSVNYGDSWTPVDIIGSARGVPIRAISVNPHDGKRITFASSKAIYVQVEGNRWIVTDTKSNQSVRVIEYDPQDPETLYIGFYNVQ